MGSGEKIGTLKRYFCNRFEPELRTISTSRSVEEFGAPNPRSWINWWRGGSKRRIS